MGPAEHDTNASDLHHINPENYFFKFADDTYLIVGASMRSTLQEKLDGVAHWAANNNLRLNTATSKEMLIPRGGRWRTEAPSLLVMERVGSLRILGVIIVSDISVSA